MKQLIIALILTLTLFPAIAAAEYRSIHGVIISTLDGVSTILGEDGNLWDIDSEPDLWEADRVFLVLDDNDTPGDVTDDTVLLNWYDPKD